MASKDNKKASLSDLDTDMRAHWYPVSFSKHLSKDTPVGLHLLGDPIAIFRDSNGRACCVADVCAHRSAPLSIGRMTDGELECKYHGWRYNSEGKVTHIPALEKHKTIPKSASTKVYPCHEMDGLIWVYPQIDSSAKADPAEIPNLTPGGRENQGYWTEAYDIAVDLNIDHSLMVENLLDPAHLPFTHENTLAKRSDATPLHMDVSTAKNKIIGIKSFPEHRAKPGTKFTFTVPCHISIYVNPKPGWEIELSMSCVPTRPGHMRLIFRQGRTFFKFMNKLPFYHQIMERRSMKIVMQDYELLHGQQTRLHQQAKPWVTPIQVDRLPFLYRSWYYSAMKAKPFFEGYNSTDIEDLDKMNGQCFSSGGCHYDENVFPNQEGVDNSAYFMDQKGSSSSLLSLTKIISVSATVCIVSIVLSKWKK